MSRFAKSLAVLVAALFAFPGLAQETTAGLMVHDPYARVLGGIGASGAVFFVLHNHSDADVTLTGVSTGAAQMAGLHTHVESDDGMMQMMPIDGGIALPAWGEHIFARGGDHIMLMGLTEALKDGDSLTVTLTFDGAPPLTFKAIIDNDRAP